MNKIYRNLLEIADNFDVFLFDAFGVFWSGKECYPNSLETMAELVKRGKTVYVLSNATQVSSDAIKSNEKKGLFKGIHYDEFITSGEIARKILVEGSLKFDSNEKPETYYIFGTPNKKLFADTKYVNVENPKDADFFYISIPQLSDEQRENMAQYKSELFASKLPKEGEPAKWDSMVIDVFKPELEKLLALNLPAFNANPDYRATETDKIEDITRFVVRQGSIAHEYEMMGGEVVEIGKPHQATYDFVFDMLKVNGKMPKDKKKIAMIGDTVRTDIRGGNLAGISTILCAETGVVANEAFIDGYLHDDILEKIYTRESGKADYIIRSVGGNDLPSKRLQKMMDAMFGDEQRSR